MFQEFEGQKPIVISRNHMDRVRPKTYRWTAPKDWSPAWNLDRALMTGALSGLLRASYLQIHTPLTELHRAYMFPNSFGQARIFLSEAYKMDNFQRGFGSRLSFYLLYSLSFNSARFYMWHDYNGGYTVDEGAADISWFKKLLTSIYVGLATSWIPVPFYNIAIRYHQDTILPPEFSRGYRGYLHAAVSIAKNDGLLPFTRSSTPTMLRYALETSGMFFWTDFAKDKCRHFQHFGSNLGGYSDSAMRLVYTSFGTFIGLIYGYSFDNIRKYVELLPRNAKGEKYFDNYAEGAWKTVGEYYSLPGVLTGFGKHLVRNGPSLFLTLWFADTIGLLDANVIQSLLEPDS